MAEESIENQSLDQLLKGVQGLSAMGADAQMRSITAVFAKCTLELGKSIGSASEEIRRFNNSTTKLTEQIIRLNKILVAATVVGAVAAIIGAISTLSN